MLAAASDLKDIGKRNLRLSLSWICPASVTPHSDERGTPAPGANRGRSLWHGWRNRMMEMGELLEDDASRSLARGTRAAKVIEK